jgi:hypothetical protein
VRVHNLLKGMILCAITLCAIQVFSSLAYGTIINYADVTGTNVKYTNISEQPTRSTFPGPDNPLPKFNQPTGGDSLSFALDSFYAHSPFGGTADMCDSNFQTTISTKSSTTGISSVSFTDFGDYRLLRSTTTSNPIDFVNATGYLTVTEVNGLNITPFVITSQFNYQYQLTGTNLTTTPQLLVPWTGSLNFNVSQALTSHGYQAGSSATKAILSLDNSLVAMSDANSDAYIRKMSASLTTSTVVVPEPSALILLSMGLLGLGMYSRKK